MKANAFWAAGVNRGCWGRCAPGRMACTLEGAWRLTL